MNCPRCEGKPLVAEIRFKIEVDRCAACDGVWLDKGEDEALTRPEEVLPAALIDKVAAMAVSNGVDDSPALSCPRCQKTMGREHYAKSDVEIDRCGCGVWLDKGELEKITIYRSDCLEQLEAMSTTKAGEAEADLDFAFSPDVLEQSFARIYFALGGKD
jgi:Zn-finger nucleic acid-binding protein